MSETPGGGEAWYTGLPSPLVTFTGIPPEADEEDFPRRVRSEPMSPEELPPGPPRPDGYVIIPIYGGQTREDLADIITVDEPEGEPAT